MGTALRNAVLEQSGVAHAQQQLRVNTKPDLPISVHICTLSVSVPIGSVSAGATALPHERQQSTKLAPIIILTAVL